MFDKLDDYRRAERRLPKAYRLWPLYGVGFENMGRDGKPVEEPLPTYGPDELLIRHDSSGLCFFDTKVIAQGQSPPRIFRDMQKEPVVLGHEFAMTIVGVDQGLRERYRVGDRLTLETGIVVKGKTYAYGYLYQGGLSQYSVIGPEIYASDLGNNLIKVRPDKGYAENALTEPWACVVAVYALKYRTGLKQGGITWIIGAGGDRPYTINSGFDAGSHPTCLLLTDVPARFAAWLKERAAQLGVEVTEVPSIAACPVEFVEDIVLLGASADLIEQASPQLAQFGVMAILAEAPLERRVSLDVERIHYHRWVYVGTTKNDVAAAYAYLPVRSNLKPRGRAWFVGAGGSIGRMHVQHAIEFNDPPAAIVCSDVSDMRLNELCEAFAGQARERGIQFVCLNPLNKADYEAQMASFQKIGFNDIVVLDPVPTVIAEAGSHLAPQGVMNIFAGVARGTLAALDLSGAYLSGTRIIGHSASLMSDFELVLAKTNSGELSPNRSVAAVGSSSAARDGLKAIKEAALTGKVVIYPNIKELPLTPLAEFKEKLPTVYLRLNARGEWTNAVKRSFCGRCCRRTISYPIHVTLTINQTIFKERSIYGKADWQKSSCGNRRRGQLRLLAGAGRGVLQERQKNRYRPWTDAR